MLHPQHASMHWAGEVCVGIRSVQQLHMAPCVEYPSARPKTWMTLQGSYMHSTSQIVTLQGYVQPFLEPSTHRLPV